MHLVVMARWAESSQKVICRAGVPGRQFQPAHGVWVVSAARGVEGKVSATRGTAFDCWDQVLLVMLTRQRAKGLIEHVPTRCLQGASHPVPQQPFQRPALAQQRTVHPRH